MPADQRYDPVPPIPSYDEAIGGGGNGAGTTTPSSSWRHSGISPVDERSQREAESQTLLSSPSAGSRIHPRRRPDAAAYHQPTVETDDESDDGLSGLGSDDGDDEDAEREAAQVRREMQELEMDDGDSSSSSRGSIWGKRIPQWAWRWRVPGSWSSLATSLRLPGRLRPTIRLGEDNTGAEPSRRDADAGGGIRLPGHDAGGESESRWARLGRLWRLGGAADSTAPPATSTDQASSPARWSSTVLFLIFARALAALIVVGFVYLLFASDVFASLSRKMGGGTMFDPESVRVYVQSNIDTRRIRETAKHFSRYAHVAGTEGDYALAIDAKNAFVDAGMDQVTVDEYFVYLNYPVEGKRTVQILSAGQGSEPLWTAQLEEPDLRDHSDNAPGHEPFVFHGLSRSGEVFAPVVYARYGGRGDFEMLRKAGVETKGTIALMRYYGAPSDRAVKVKAAELAGCVGAIIYSDPADDGFLRGPVAPNGRYMPADGVQRGSVGLTSWVVGDVLTPGWESTKGMPRMTRDNNPGLVGIPSLPMAWRDAQVLLQHLRGFGHKLEDADHDHEAGGTWSKDWVGGVPDVGEWWTGNSSGPVVRLRNDNDEIEQQPIWNVYSKIPGVEQPHHPVIVGAHRDAWSFGATDPASGTAVLLELVKVFGTLMDHGWRPLRSIEFMSWDAEEYNLIGSTEFVEKNVDHIRANAVAYINLDSVVSGDELHASGSPVFRRVLLRALDRVADLNYNTTLRDRWDRRGGELEGLGAGSDYVAFQDIAGTSSLDLSFSGPPYPYHSSYDNFDWMDRVGDPDFTYHGLVAQIVALLILELADRPVVPFDMPAYADSLLRWVGELETWTARRGDGSEGVFSGFGLLREAVDEVAASVRQFHKWEVDWETSVLANNGWEGLAMGREREEYNRRMGMFETNLLDLEVGGGVPNRTQYKHVLFGPDLWGGYDAIYFPAIRDAVTAGNWTLANVLVAKTAKILGNAAAELIK